MMSNVKYSPFSPTIPNVSYVVTNMVRYFSLCWTLMKLIQNQANQYLRSNKEKQTYLLFFISSAIFWFVFHAFAFLLHAFC